MIRKKQKKSQAGFTLIELLVAMATFMIVIVVVVDIFVTGMGGTQRIFAQQTIQESGRYILESISKEVRMSEIAIDEDGAYSTLSIINSKGEAVDYVFDDESKQLSRIKEGETDILSDSNTEIIGGFYVKKVGVLQPRVTMVMKIRNKASEAKAQAEINLQTTISSREYAL